MSARHARNRDFHDMYEQALECDGWGDVRRRAPRSSMRLETSLSFLRDATPPRFPTRPSPPPFPARPVEPSTPNPARKKQVDAAETAYRRLRDAVRGEAETHEILDLSRWELQQTAKLLSVLSLRVDELRTGRDLGVGAGACKELRLFFDQYLLYPNAEFPFDVDPEAVGALPVERQLERIAETGSFASHDSSLSFRGDSLLPPVRSQRRGDRALIFKLIKIGVKDADKGGYIDARAFVSVVSTPSGDLIEATQETPVALRREPQHVVFDDDTFVHVQTPLRVLLETAKTSGGDVSFVIELRHFKPKKKKTSVKGWCFFSLSELDLSRATQKLSLEVYAKPTDLRCKKMSLLSVKELYAHVDVIVQTE